MGAEPLSFPVRLYTGADFEISPHELQFYVFLDHIAHISGKVLYLSISSGKMIQKYTGYSISQYVIERRMGEAQRMLIFEDISIKEIALAVGYENIQYFYAAFKKSTGVKPLEFRNQFR